MKPSAMCCTTTTAGVKSLGKAPSRCARACGPPVDAPIATRSTVSSARARADKAADAPAADCASLLAFRRPRGWVMTRTLDATRTPRRSASAYDARSASRAVGLATTSIAPAARAAAARAASPSVEHTRMGVGTLAMIRSMISIAAVPGNSRSRTTADGRSRSIKAMASRPVRASPTTQRPGSAVMAERRKRRSITESSTSTTVTADCSWASGLRGRDRTGAGWGWRLTRNRHLSAPRSGSPAWAPPQ